MNLIRSILTVVAVAIALTRVTAGDPDEQKAQIYDFGKMTEVQAKSLAGKRIRVRLRISQIVYEPDVGPSYGCSGDGNVNRSVVFQKDGEPNSDQAKKELLVDGQVSVERAKDGATVYMQVTDAKIVKP